MKQFFVIIALLHCIFDSNVYAQDTLKTQKNNLDFSIGYSRYFVDPDAHLKLSGITGEVKKYFGGKNLDFLSKGLLYIKEITFAYSTILEGRINASALSVSYGRRYEFPRFYFGFGVGPFSYWLFSNKKKDPHSNYSLDTGLRLNVYYIAGINITIKKNLSLSCNINYNYTVKKVYWHNPFAPHKHKDLFHYLTLSIGYRHLK